VDAGHVKELIRAAFSSVEYPGDWCLRGSNDGVEPYELEARFRGKTDWRALDSEFLDQDPIALCFFSDEAFRFYLPAYLIADLDGRLFDVRPVFHLTHGLTDAAKAEPVNPRRYGPRTWFESTSYQLAVFDRAQASAIVAYLEYVREGDEFERAAIDQALVNFWRPRAAVTA
jgi:hypothetical protein